MALLERNGARNIEENERTSQRLETVMDEILSNHEELAEIEKNAKSMAITDATDRISDIIVSLVKK